MSTPPLPRPPFMRSAPFGTPPQDAADLADILRRSGAVLPPDDVEKLLRPFTGLLPAPSTPLPEHSLLVAGEAAVREIACFVAAFFTSTLARKGAISLAEIVLEAMKTIDRGLDRLGAPSTPETRAAKARKGVKKSPKSTRKSPARSRVRAPKETHARAFPKEKG